MIYFFSLFVSVIPECSIVVSFLVSSFIFYSQSSFFFFSSFFVNIAAPLFATFIPVLNVTYIKAAAKSSKNPPECIILKTFRF